MTVARPSPLRLPAMLRATLAPAAAVWAGLSAVTLAWVAARAALSWQTDLPSAVALVQSLTIALAGVGAVFAASAEAIRRRLLRLADPADPRGMTATLLSAGAVRAAALAALWWAGVLPGLPAAMFLAILFFAECGWLGRVSPVLAQRRMLTVLWTMTAATLGVLLFIIAFILFRGLGHVTWQFLTESPSRMGREGGVFPIIVGTLLVAGLAVALSAVVGVAAAIYLTEYTTEGRLTAVIRFGADCLAAVPSIVFGLFGFIFFAVFLGFGLSILSGALTLAVMVLPTIIRTSEEAIRAVPRSHREVSYGLGSSQWQMVTRVVLRSALPGIATGVVLSLGRAVSETAVVMLTAGYGLRLPRSAFDSVRTLALHFYVLAREGISLPRAYATASLLIITILAINLAAYALMRRFATRSG